VILNTKEESGMEYISEASFLSALIEKMRKKENK
jgi:hypothetical protein